MNKSIIALSSVNYAIKGERLLNENAIKTRVVKLQPEQTKNGCAYGLEVDHVNVAAATTFLTNAGIAYREIVR